jgi:predicted AlkP superfamily phosphohydrolase/phosphomutase
MEIFDQIRNNTDKRVAFIGIDGLPYELVNKNPNVFPNLIEIAEQGTGGQISSTVPPESSACWPALTTGTNPGKAGVCGFQSRKDGTYETQIHTRSHITRPQIWDIVSNNHRDASVFNVPVTFPPSSRVQRQVSGFLSPELNKATTDSKVRQTIESFGYQLDVNIQLGHRENKSEFLKDANKTLAARIKTFAHYIQKSDWDLFFGVFMSTDRVNHLMFGDYANDGEYKREFLEFYRTLDSHIGKIKNLLNSSTELIVASGHGFTQLDHEVYLNQWLADNGWLDYASTDHSELADIDQASKAYSLGSGRVYLNLEDREPNGAVSKDEYETVRNELIAELKRFIGPDGRKVCRKIIRSEDVFSRDQTETTPDVIIIPTDGYDLKAGFTGQDNVFKLGHRSGMHKPENACLFSTDPGLSLEGADILDIAPTITDLMGINTQTDRFDGLSLVG